MAQRLLTEDGKYLVMETVLGITGASLLNDTAVSVIEKETFTTNPLENEWLIGSGWAWDETNGNMEIA